MFGGYQDFITQWESEGRNANTFFWDQGNRKKEGMREEKKQILGMWKSRGFVDPTVGESGVYFSLMPSVSGVFPEQTVQLLQIHTMPVSCQAWGSDSQRVLCRLAYKLLRFPKGYGSSERKGYIHFSEDNCKLPLPLGLPVASPSESFAWGDPQQKIPVLFLVLVELV